jgi:excisionase family DNA binding protein
MTTQEVADHFRTSPETIRYWKHIGKIKGIRPGRKTLYHRDEVARIEAEQLAGDAA